jgi:quinol monooxygenase YgiN
MRRHTQAGKQSVTSDFFVFTRCYAEEGQQSFVAAAIQEVIAPTRQEPGCLRIEAFGSTQNQRLFHIHSRWKNEAAFDNHLQLPHTIRFLNTIQALLDRPIDVTRAEVLR